jgi:hypothetical protein
MQCVKNFRKSPQHKFHENLFCGSQGVTCRQADRHGEADRHIFTTFSYESVNKSILTHGHGVRTYQFQKWHASVEQQTV